MKENKSSEEYLKLFNRVFDTKLKLENKQPLLHKIYEDFADRMYVFTKEQEQIREESLKKFKQLKTEVTPEQLETISYYIEIEEMLGNTKQEQSFFFGYLLAKELEKESNI